MGWISGWEGVFKLHDSDRYCGSKISLEDAAEILSVRPAALSGLPRREENGVVYLCENDLYRAWCKGGVLSSPHKPRVGTNQRSLDELILLKLAQLTFPNAKVTTSVPFGKKSVDLRIEHGGKVVLVEFDGPSHFI